MPGVCDRMPVVRTGLFATARTAVALAAALGATAARAELKVVATIKPLHALATEILGGTGTATVLVSGNASPHSYALKPSEAKSVASADVFIRVSEGLEPFTGRLVKALPSGVRVLTLVDAPGLRLLDRRRGATFDHHDRGGNTHSGHGHGDEEGGGGRDGHIWLDPVNAKAMARAIATALAERSPADAQRLRANAERVAARLDALTAELEQTLKPLAGKPFVVFHDAYQYLETRFGLTAAGSITLDPEIQPSARRISQLRAKITSAGAICVFGEPQFRSRLIDTVIEGTGARAATLDPEGGLIAPGPDHYVTLMRKLAADLRACLAPG